MPRKGPAPKRPLVVDPVYGSPLVTQLVNKILLDGKKSIAERIVYGALEGCREKTGTDPVVTLKRALDNIKPTVEVKSRRVGGATYQVPIEVKPNRATTLALRWLVGYSRQRREKTMTERLMNEILDASNGLGAASSARGHPQDGRVQQGLRALPLVTHLRQGYAARAPDARGIPDCRGAAARAARTCTANETRARRGTGRPDRPHEGPQHRHHGAHRRRQDHHDRAHPLLHRHQLQDR
jgi:small subunit ribosomal protein S7